MKKAKRKFKKQKQKKIRKYLIEVNEHCAQLTAALRNLADRLDDVRSYHLENEDKENI